MPKRTRSHRLEDESIRCFESLLPTEWACRRKDKDYGVDLEIEIFDEAENSTGLMFYVQLKATDDVKKEKTVRMKWDRLEYQASLECPSIVARYCSPAKQIYWSWVSDIFARTARDNNATSVSVSFTEDNLWSSVTTKALIQTLRIYRTIRHMSKRAPIGLSVKQDCPKSQSNFDLQCAVLQIRKQSQLISGELDPEKCIPVTVCLEDDSVIAAIDVVSSVRIHLESMTREEIFSQLVYAIGFMAAYFEFSRQANDLANIICENKLVCHSRDVAAKFACRLIDSLRLSSEIASLNKLHEKQDGPCYMYLLFLLHSKSHNEERSKAIERFYDEAIQFCRINSVISLSTLHYSFGNFFHTNHQFFDAVKQYNLARKSSSEYCQRDYFLSELAGSLYFRRRYRLSARCYELSFNISGSDRAAICAGDAFLFSGDLEKALEFFERANSSCDELLRIEASLKYRITRWCVGFYAKRGTDEKMQTISRVSFWADAYNYFISEEEPLNAFASCAMLSFLLVDVEDVWMNAVVYSSQVSDPSLFYEAFACAMRCCGYELYAKLRDTLCSVGVEANELESLDAIAEHLNTLCESVGSDEPTIRLVDGTQVLELPKDPKAPMCS
nr:DUF4365 domain-containing protein [uncultured Cohaesibacter sp.]